MQIKYEIHKLENVHGEGNRKNYVSLRTQKPMDEEHIAEVVEANSTLKKGDIKAVFTEFRQRTRLSARDRLAVGKGRPQPQGTTVWLQDYGQGHLDAGHPTENREKIL